MEEAMRIKRTEIQQYWDEFFEQGTINGKVRPVIAQSWQRCRENRLSPDCGMMVLPAVSLNKIMEENKMLIGVAEPILARMTEIVSESQYVITLHDKTGCTISRYFAGENLVFPQDSFVLGGMLDEEHFGTNGASLCMAMDQEIKVIGAEHYHRRFHPVNCFASPIHGEDGEVIGCLNMVGHPENNSYHTLGLVSSVAYLIESQLTMTRVVTRVTNTFRIISEGLVVLDENYKVRRVSSYTSCILNVGESKLLGMDFREVFAYEDFEQRVETERTAFSYPEYGLKIGEDTVPCNVTVTPVFINEQNAGVVLILRECKAVTQLTNQVVGNRSYYTFDDIITQDREILAQINTMRDIAKTDCSVLIEGESGAGKELFAHSLHSASKRAKGPFVVVNCASLPRSLVESELFGYEKGAFTGANTSGSPGKFELADGGTIFLDEIGELPLEIQAKLLRVLDNHRVLRIGGKTEKHLDVRVIAATNRNLYREVQEKGFRGDLYFRINVVKFDIPPLRNRGKDVCALSKFFLKEMNKKEQVSVKYFTEDLLAALQAYSWPGNVRELHNAVVRAYYASKTAAIDICDLPGDVQRGTVQDACGISGDISRAVAGSEYVQKEGHVSREYPVRPSMMPQRVLSLQSEVQSVGDFERMQIIAAIQTCGGDVVAAGASLGLSKSTVYRRVKKYAIDVKNFE